jgi:hypothetical protein
MFTLNEYEKYRNHYVPNARLIRVEKKRCNWNPNTEQFDFKSYSNYAISFNKSGRLMHVYASKGLWNEGKIDKIIFLYNKKNRPVTLLKFNLKSQILNYTLNLHYDSHNRIIQEIMEFENSGSYENYIHKYSDGNHTVLCHQDYYELTTDIVKEKINSKGKVIEQKIYRFGGHVSLFEKYIYSSDGKLLYCFSLDEESKVSSETQYNGNFETIIDRKDSNSISVDETQTQYNDKGHWVKKCTIRNGSLKFIEERSIKYYD